MNSVIPIDQRVGDPLIDRLFAPGEILGLGFLAGRAAIALGDGQQALRSIRAAVENDILADLAQLGIDLVVDRELAGVDDAHVHPRLDGVVEEHRVHRLAHRLVSAEGERQVRDAARDMRVGQRSAYPPRRLDEGDAVAVVLVDAGRDRKDVGVEDDVLRREADFLCQELVGARADRHLALERVRLALLVERHDHDRRAVAAHEARMMQERLLAFLHRDGVDQALALQALEAGFDDREFRRIDHHRHAGDVRLGGDEIEELDHRGFGVDETLIHVDVDDLRPGRHLVAGDGKRAGEIAGRDQLAKLRRARDVRAFADVHERDVGGEGERLEAGEAHQRRDRRNWARPDVADRLGDRADVVGRRAAAAADDVDEAVAGEAADLGRHRLGAFVVLAEGVGKAGVGIGADERVGRPRNLFEVLAHGARAERTVEADGEGLGVPDRMPEGGRRLAGERAAGAVGDRAGDHQRQAQVALGEGLLAGENRGLGVQRVEDGLDQDQVRAAVDQAADLLAVGDPEIVEGDGAVARIVDVGRQGRRAVGRPEGAGDEPSLAVGLLRLDRRAPGQARAVAVEIVDRLLHAVVGLGDRRRGERIGFEDIRPSHGVGEMDVLDRLRLGQRQEVVVTLQVALARQKTLAAEMALGEAERLDLRAHRPVENQNAPLRRFAQRGGGALPVHKGRVEEGVERRAHWRPQNSGMGIII